MNELISVVLPVYRVEKFIRKSIESVLGQSYNNLEIVLVDDGSPDDCGAICDSYAVKDTRVKVVHKENGGLSDARNAGIDVAHGRYITFVDSDDYVSEDYVKVLYEALAEDMSDISVASSRVIYAGSVIDRSTGERSCMPSKIALKRLLYDDGIDISACFKLYKKELFDGIRYPVGKLFEDTATTYKLIDRASKVSLVSEPVYNYVMRRCSITQNRFSPAKMDLVSSTCEMCESITEKYPDLAPAAKRRMAYANLSTLSKLAESGESFPDEQKELTSGIRKNAFPVLFDSLVPLRDKLGLVSSLFGFSFYRFVWKVYRRMSGRTKRN